MKRNSSLFFAVLIAFLFINNSIIAQESCCSAKNECSYKVEYFPDDLNIHPFTANMIEPRMGVHFQTGKNDLRLDIGNTRDLIKITTKNDWEYSFGADFFTYTRLRGETDFHFPVDAVDYLFGFNIGVKKELEKWDAGLRFRLSHISAHFVDGHYDKALGGWRDNKEPNVYSREFVEFFPYLQNENHRMYVGVSYLFHVNPETVGKGIYQLGLERYVTELTFAKITPFVAYDLKLSSPSVLAATNTLMVGLKAGKPFEPGFSLIFTYFNGYNIHGEYYNQREDYTSIGINVDL